ncbi:MAG TPA: general stress protein, partial [Vicinamibacterales bacterium]|nr:general stress protein [Vicinamibacterales bacterium]
MATRRDRTNTATAASRRTIASYSTYAEAEHAVDWLSDHGFAVERSAIVGTGLRSVEQVTGRMTPGRAAGIGAAQGALIGALFALLFGIFFTGPEFVELL